jgi:hypothetical protein
MGHVATCEEMRERYRVDEVKYSLFLIYCTLSLLSVLFSRDFWSFFITTDPVYDKGRIVIDFFVSATSFVYFIF